ncbi:response regulator [Nocardioides sp.]|uniref:response regulator n=1 Tax=Nocardioides sp. TaxID=35761 RepID=UPI0025E6ACD7|nr:response regulator [Nocardioides sp.]
MTTAGRPGIDVVIDLLTRLAQGDYAARGDRTGLDEDFEAVVVGIEMLAEELDAQRAELEAQVRARTAELEVARNQAIEASRLKSQFLATMSHEIRTPLNGVIGLGGLLLTTELNAVQRRYAEGLTDAGEALLAVINDILDFSKLEAGMVELEHRDFDPRALVEGVASILGTPAPPPDVELIAHCDAGVPQRLVGDEARLRQILLNLGSNAVKFTHRGEIVLTARVAAQEGRHVRVRFDVADTGIGIDVEAQRTLFDSFTQAEVSTTRKYGGTGLGLSICKSLAEAMGGTIGVDSALGRGSTFWVEIPMPVAETQIAPGPDPHPLQGRRVLVVDDNETHRLVLQSQLSEWGLRPDVVAHAEAVVPLLRSAAQTGNPYPVAVLDLGLPDLDGLTLARRITADPELTTTRLVLLGNGVGIEPAALGEVRVDHVLAKPVRSSELLEVLLDLVPAPPVVARDEERPVARTAGAEGRGRVLVVEDDRISRVVAQGLIGRAGYPVDLAGNGAEALDAIAREDYALVLMDCHMPVMDGFDATTEIRRREADGARLPVVALTAASTPEERARCRAAGMDGFLAKPLDVAALEAVLARYAAAEPEVADDPEASEETHVVLDPERLKLLRGLGPDDGRGLLGAVAAAFTSSTPELLSAIRAAAEGRDEPGLRQAAHQLAGSAANLGAVRVAEVARRIEHAPGDPGARVLVDQLEVEYDDARWSLDRLMGA